VGIGEEATPREIVDLYESGMTVAAIARRCRRSTTTVSRVLAEQGVERRGRWGEPLDPDLVVEEYLAGASAAEIAARHGRTPSVVAAILRRRGVRRRTRWDDKAPVDPAEVAGEYLSGDSLREVAQRHCRSITWVRETLESLGIPRRPRGGVYKDVSDGLIVQLRDVGCLSWEEIADRVEMRPESVAMRYAGAPGALDHERYNFAGAEVDVDVWVRNDAANHRREIVAAHRSGESAESLSRQWGISETTVRRWVAKATR
jgi:lambda repressor-like predicted transcriptional regulator